MKNYKLLLISIILVIASNVWADVTYTLSSGTLTFSYSGSGSSAMTDYVDYDGSGSPKRPATWTSSVTHVVINEGVTTIGSHAFQGCSSLQDISIPTSVTTCKTGAFTGCTSMARIYYSGSPNQWAIIDFADYTAHPFGALSGTADYYFYGDKSNKTNTLVFFPPLTQIKQYTFYRIYLYGSSNGLSIPGTVASIGNYAFYGCNIQGPIAINRKESPAMGTDAFRGIGTNRTLYVPSGANGYRTSGSNWYFSLSSKDVSGNTLGDCGENVKWDLNQDGVLTLDATSGDKEITIDAASTTKMPWYYFRRLVHKVKIKGEVTALNNLLHYHYGISEVILDQATIPTISSTYIATSTSTAYAALFNKHDKLKLSIKAASLTDGSVINLESAPWNDDSHWQVQLAEPALFDQNIDNSAWLTAADTYLDIKTFDLQLRSLSNSFNNTFCSPVTLTREQVEEIWGDDTKVAAMTETSINDKGEIVLTFAEIGEIGENYLEAGTPYLVWPETDETDGVTPIVRNVNLSDITTTGKTVNTDYMAFTGILAPKAITEDEKNNQSIIFLTTSFSDSGNQILTWANGGTLKGQRAYWQFKESTPASAMARRPILKFSDENNTATGIDPVTDNPSPVTLKQLRDGQLIIIKNGKTYNAQGAYLR